MSVGVMPIQIEEREVSENKIIQTFSNYAFSN